MGTKKWMWIILILMSVALLGLVSIQAYWINYSVQLNQAKFDQSVQNALSSIVQGIERESRESLQNIEQREIELLRDRGMTNEFRIKELMSEFQDVQNLLGIIDINEILDARFIDKLVKSELENRGVRLEYHYGVYSHKSEAFIIIDGVNQYVAPLDSEGDQTDIVVDDGNVLSKAHYRANIFPSIFGPRAIFMLHFPNRGSVGWNESWLLLTGSIVFLLLILFVFAYTLFTIVRQKKLSEMKTDFINNMTHEFKTPIATISLATDSLKSEKIQSHPDKINHFVHIIKQENARMLKQVERVLQIAMVDKRDFSLFYSEIDIHDVIQLAVENMALRVEKRNGAIKTELNAIPSAIRADETHITNIIHNLLDNAEKYSEGEPEILISTSNSNTGIVIKIKDNGVGMTPEEQKHIFDKFYRIQSGNIHDVKGFGLGLSYVKAIVTAHHGEISVNSAKGKGAEFTINLPYS